jgi:hypothetical protein
VLGFDEAQHHNRAAIERFLHDRREAAAVDLAGCGNFA